MGAVSKVSTTSATPTLETKLDNRVWVNTPEQIRFQYETIGGLKRAIALLLDFIFIWLIIGALWLVMWITLGLIMLLMAISMGQASSGILDALSGFGSGFFSLLFFSIWWFYGVIQEYRYRGRTWGKMCLGIRVLSLDGRSPTLAQCVWRNFLRLADALPLFPAIFLFPADFVDWASEADMQNRTVIQVGFAVGNFMPTFLVAIAAMMLTLRNQRIGDLFAGTMVVKSQNYGAPIVPVFHDVDLLYLATQIPRRFVPGRELVETLSLFVSRRQRFSHDRRREIAGRLAPLFISEFGLPETTDPDLVLGALYLRAVCDPGHLEKMFEDALRQRSLLMRGPHEST
ncbi:MAG: RDD family protein [Planctomycetaceae bacterium]|nr:RDD family protein [Planctomycetaceae bacterium]